MFSGIAFRNLARWLRAAVLVSGAIGCAAQAQDDLQCPQIVRNYNYVLGTQAIGGPYQFTSDSLIIEQARQIDELGSNLLKLSLARGAAPRYGAANAAAGARTTLEYIEAAPQLKQAFDMDFHYYQAWVHSFTGANWRDGVDGREAKAYYKEMYELAAWLLTSYSGTGKVFMLGNWEGDWLLLGGPGRRTETPPMEAVGGMIDWLNIRQQAIDDAKAAVNHHDVGLYHYVEVNLVTKALEGKRSIAHSVLPKTNVDLVSYSSYEAIKRSKKPDIDSIRGPLTEIVDYLEGQLKPKPGLPFARRVFIGEYGYHADRTMPLLVKQQFMKSRFVMQVALELDLPFALIWQFYNNEYAPDGTSKEMSMINEVGQMRALYHLHQRYFSEMRSFVAETCRQTASEPNPQAFRAKAYEILETLSFGEMQRLSEQGIADNVP